MAAPVKDADCETVMGWLQANGIHVELTRLPHGETVFEVSAE